MEIREAITFDDVLLEPRYSEVTPDQVELSTHLTKTLCMRIPLISSPMDTITESKMALAMSLKGGVGVIHRNMTPEQQANEVRAVSSRWVGAAVGATEKHYDRVLRLIDAGVAFLVIDSAHAHSENVGKMVRYIKDRGAHCIAGNVATADGAEFLCRHGADAIKVGIGPGSICTTRIISGVGVPQITAIMDCAEAAKPFDVPVIADGGIRTSGDAVKALAAGASSIMIGNLFAACDETPGQVVMDHEHKQYKVYRGMGSLGAMQAGSADRYGGNGSNKVVAEGVESRMLLKGSVSDAIDELTGGIRSGLGYCGAGDIIMLHERARFLKVTKASVVESHPHSLT